MSVLACSIGVALFANGEDPFLDGLGEMSANRPEGPFVHNATALAQARSIAEYLSLRPISEVHLPLPLNFVFIGFGADGAMNVEIPMKELEVRGIEIEESAV